METDRFHLQNWIEMDGNGKIVNYLRLSTVGMISTSRHLWSKIKGHKLFESKLSFFNCYNLHNKSLLRYITEYMFSCRRKGHWWGQHLVCVLPIGLEPQVWCGSSPMCAIPILHWSRFYQWWQVHHWSIFLHVVPSQVLLCIVKNYILQLFKGSYLILMFWMISKQKKRNKVLETSLIIVSPCFEWTDVINSFAY